MYSKHFWFLDTCNGLDEQHYHIRLTMDLAQLINFSQSIHFNSKNVLSILLNLSFHFKGFYIWVFFHLHFSGVQLLT